MFVCLESLFNSFSQYFIEEMALNKLGIDAIDVANKRVLIRFEKNMYNDLSLNNEVVKSSIFNNLQKYAVIILLLFYKGHSDFS